jgi:cardiolipin synthase
MTNLTVANQLTLLRMLLIPAFVLLVVYDALGWALVVLFVAGITDALDGLIARRTGQKTTLGAWLDPMADKLLLTSAFIVLTVPGTNLVNLAIGPRTFKPSQLGKVATATYIVTALAFMVVNYLQVRTPLVAVCVYTSAAITIASSLHYITYVARIANETDAR